MKTLFEIYEKFGRDIYEKTGSNEEIEIIVPKAHYSMLMQEFGPNRLQYVEPVKIPHFVKIFTSRMTIRIVAKL